MLKSIPCPAIGKAWSCILRLRHAYYLTGHPALVCLPSRLKKKRVHSRRPRELSIAWPLFRVSLVFARITAIALQTIIGIFVIKTRYRQALLELPSYGCDPRSMLVFGLQVSEQQLLPKTAHTFNYSSEGYSLRLRHDALHTPPILTRMACCATPMRDPTSSIAVVCRRLPAPRPSLTAA